MKENGQVPGNGLVPGPDQWMRGDEPMTGPQASFLRTLLEETGRSAGDLDQSLTKRSASKLIHELQRQTGRDSERSRI